MSDLGVRVNVGTRVRTSAVFSALGAATPVDPDVVSVAVRSPAGAVTTLVYGTDAAVERASAGTFGLLHVIDAKGTWWFSWTASSSIDGVNAVEEIAVIGEGTVLA